VPDMRQDGEDKEIPPKSVMDVCFDPVLAANAGPDLYDVCITVNRCQNKTVTKAIGSSIESLRILDFALYNYDACRGG
jgi:hypothetical protein